MYIQVYEHRGISGCAQNIINLEWWCELPVVDGKCITIGYYASGSNLSNLHFFSVVVIPSRKKIKFASCIFLNLRVIWPYLESRVQLEIIEWGWVGCEELCRSNALHFFRSVSWKFSSVFRLRIVVNRPVFFTEFTKEYTARLPRLVYSIS